MCSVDSSSGSWLTNFRKSLNFKPKKRLVLFPYAGGGPTTYRSWQAHFSQDIEVICAHLPGREDRILERPEECMATVSSALVNALSDLPLATTLFFGHSLGALIAYDVAHKLQSKASLHTPSKIVLSGCAPPHILWAAEESPPCMQSDEELVAKLREMNGTPEEVLASGELLALILPMVRADLKLANDARTILSPGLSIRAHILGGLEDKYASLEDLKQWGVYLQNDLQITMFPGGHFFLNAQARSICSIISTHLRNTPERESI